MSLLHRSAVLLVLLATPAAAQDATNTVVYYRAGNWEAFTGSAANGGTFCGIKTGNPQDGRGLMIRYRTGGDRLVFRARKPSWAIPSNTSITVAMQFGPGMPWTLPATGEQDVVEWSIPQDAMVEFDTRFRFGSVMWLSFPGGSEAPWSVSLAGSNAAGLTLGRCIRELSAQTAPMQPAPTQPYAGGAQRPMPPGAAPSATQPFGPTNRPPPAAQQETETPPPQPVAPTR